MYFSLVILLYFWFVNRGNVDLVEFSSRIVKVFLEISLKKKLIVRWIGLEKF